MTPQQKALLENANHIDLAFWNTGNYKTSDDAAEQAALYPLRNPITHGYPAYSSAIESAIATADMIGALNDTAVFVTVDNQPLFECPLAEADTLRTPVEEALRTDLQDALAAVQEILENDEQGHRAGDPSGSHAMLVSLQTTLRTARRRLNLPPLEVRIQLAGGRLTAVHATRDGVAVAILDWDNKEPAAVANWDRLEKEIEAGLGTTWFKAY